MSISPALQFRDSGQTLSSQHQHGGGGGGGGGKKTKTKTKPTPSKETASLGTHGVSQY